MVKLTPKQEEAYQMFEKTGKILLQWSTGKGKTLFCSYAIRKFWIEKGYCARTLIVCPPGTFNGLRDAFRKNGFSEEYYEILNDEKSKERFKRHQFKPITVMSYGLLIQKQFIFLPRNWRRHPDMKPTGHIAMFNPEFLIFDESHQIKEDSAQRTKCAKMTTRLPKVSKKILCSATPRPNGEKDLFSQLFVLDGGERLGRSFLQFESRFMIDLNQGRRGTKGYFPKRIVKSDKVGEFNQRISDIYHILDKETDGETVLPDRKVFKIKLPMTDDQRKIYKTVVDRAIIDFNTMKDQYEKRRVKKIQFYAHTMSLMAVLRQICCGFVYEHKEHENQARRGVMKIKNNKILALERALRSIPVNEKVLIWTVFIESVSQIEDLLNRMGIQYALVTGKVSNKRREEEVEKFKKNPMCRAFISHPKSGGAGLNLQQAKYSIYFSKDYSLIDKLQSEGRNYRVGSIDFHKEIVEYDLIMEGSIEEEITQNVKNKEQQVALFQRHMLNFQNQNSITNKGG